LIMIGLGFNEVLTFSLSNKNDEIDKMGLEKEQAVIIENPISEEYACLRQSLLPSIMKVLSRNKHHPLPQKVFEIGYVVNNEAKNELHLAAVKMDAKANFSECKSIVESILKGIGLEVEIEVGSNPAFIEGRTANLLYRGNLLGTFGEIHPRTIQAFGLEYPIIGLEMNLEILRGNSHRSL
ncbi:MAG: phenylalanine--tRNA ligase subunit beta, partial [Thermoplasmata archaeon]|nr:phenylalanine--tRNA ligase subunit beta [Thermoplasmata archaeon]